MSMTRGQLRLVARMWLRDEAAAAFTDQQVNQWIADAIDEYSNFFPRELAATISATAEVREYSLASLAGIQAVLEVEYPLGADPPRFLYTRSRYDPDGFWGGAYFDVKGLDTPATLVMGEKPSSGQSIGVRYYADHAYPDGDTESLTVPDRDLNLLLLHVRWNALRALEVGEATVPSLTTFVLQQLHGSSAGARLEFDQAIQQRRQHGSLGLG